MATDKKVFTLRMQPENVEKIKILAEKNKRSTAKQIEFIVERYITDYEETNGQISINKNIVSNTFIQSNQNVNNIY